MKKYIKLLFLTLSPLLLLACSSKDTQILDFSKIEKSISEDLGLPEDDNSLESLNLTDSFPIEDRLANVA